MSPGISLRVTFSTRISDMGNTTKNKKHKKTKPVYIDDGSTIADMSGVGGSRPALERNQSHPRASYKEMFQTYISAVRMMFFPMLAVLGIIALAYLIVYIIL